ncbi:MAG: ABC-F family ATP-binding cassette domain-containing protein [Solirubrobacterales bacterium]|nr:ABC-F family ATP-binding cassette domain-containing protein [Solirubrobacterales bacterium]
MAVAIASALDKDMAGEPLLRAVSFKLERRDRMTLAGRNGSGKTTLLRMLAGQASIDGGDLAIQKGARVTLHDQRPPRDRDITLREYVVSGCGDVAALEDELTRLGAEMAQRPDDGSLLDRYARAQDRFEHAGGWDWRRRALEPLHGLGFADGQLDRRLDTFSGGELTRASLARALAGTPDLLLLDEPTNHLDIDSLEWLERYLVDLDAAVVLVAHDRWFLEAVGTSVLELEAGKARFFKGTWHTWRKEKAARELALGRAIEKQEAEIARMERFVERFRAKATKARQAQSRVKRLEKMDRIERDPGETAALSFQFSQAERTGRVVFELEGGRVETPGGERTLLDGAELWLERAEHVALVGSNGSGKTTLIQTLAGERPLAAGKLRTGHNVELGYLSQHAEWLGDTGSVLDAAQRETKLSPNKARALLGRFLFSGDDAEKPLAGLSGGERQRLSLAILVHSGANVLILDEPTNHLDIESREALEDALSGFGGAVLLVSHDRALLDAVGTRTVAIEDGELHSYEGGWADYARIREERREAEAAAKAAGKAADRRAAAERAGSGGRAANRGGADAAAADGNGGGTRREGAAAGAKPLSKNARRRLAALEREVERAEAALAALEDELAGPASWSTPERSADATARHAEAKRAVEDAYREWERASAPTAAG